MFVLDFPCILISVAFIPFTCTICLLIDKNMLLLLLLFFSFERYNIFMSYVHFLFGRL
jgi:hypothetical protein